MKQVAYTVGVASVVFFMLLTGFDLLRNDTAITTETLMANVFRTLIFAMIYAAIQVALRVFRASKNSGDPREN